MRARAVPIAAGLALVAALAFGSTAGAQSPGEDSVTGFLRTPFPGGGAGMQVDAHSGPAGEQPTGTFHATFSFGAGFSGWTFHDGTVTCLRVEGDQAVVVGTGILSQGIDPMTGEPIPDEARWFHLYVQDNGPPLPPDHPIVRDVAAYEFPSTPPDCRIPAVPPPPTYLNSETAGDVVVHDAPARPTSKDQCKDGGWRAFGDAFRNQGQCVASVARGAGGAP